MGTPIEGARLLKRQRRVGRPAGHGLPYKHLQKCTKRGHVYWYLRTPNQPRVRLPVPAGVEPRDHAFLEAYTKARSGALVNEPVSARQPSGSIARAIDAFLADPAHKRGKLGDLGARALEAQASNLRKLRRDIGDLPLKGVEAQHLQRLLNRLSPSVQRKWVQAVTRLFGFVVKAGLIKVNPALNLERDRVPETDGFAAWEPGHCAAFEQAHAEDSPERLAYALAKFVGARRGDLINLQWQDITTILDRETGKQVEVLTFTPNKTAKRRVEVTIPLQHPELQNVLRHHRRDLGSVLTRLDGRPHNEQSFAYFFRAATQAAGLKGFGVHGLRKTACCSLIALGVPDRQIMLIMGWSSPAQIAVYGKKFNREIAALSVGRTIAAAARSVS